LTLVLSLSGASVALGVGDDGIGVPLFPRQLSPP
jgi:hypothetical protein